MFVLQAQRVALLDGIELVDLRGADQGLLFDVARELDISPAKCRLRRRRAERDDGRNGKAKAQLTDAIKPHHGASSLSSCSVDRPSPFI